jgi:hypothetical protein
VCPGRSVSPGSLGGFALVLAREWDRPALPVLTSAFVALPSSTSARPDHWSVAEGVAGWRPGLQWKRSPALATAGTPIHQRQVAWGALLEHA